MIASTVAFVALMISSASAFVAPSGFNGNAIQTVKSSSSMRMSVDDMLGADVETGGIFDPAGFSSRSEELARYRAVELKHGRVSMLAVLGMWVQSSGIHLPDAVFSESKPLAALSKVIAERPAALLQIVAAITYIELVAGKQSDDKAPGDIGFGEGFKPSDDAEYAALQLKELKNGRLAMVAFMGELVQELVTGQSVFEQIASGHISPFGDGQGAF